MQKELEACRGAVLRLALAYPQVEFVLASVKPGRQLLRLVKASFLLHACVSKQQPPSKHITCVTQGRNVMDVLPLIFGEQCNSLHEVMYATGSLSVQGYITVPPASFGHRHKQYLYVNNRHVRAGQLGKLVNSLFRCVMSKLDRPEEPRQKAALQYPAFALQITCPHTYYDITSEPDKSHVEFADWPAVVAAVQAAVLGAWHSVVGDKLLAELLQDPLCKAELQPAVVKASASSEHAAAASSKSHLLPFSTPKAMHSSPADIGRKRKRHQEQASCFIDTDIVSVNRLFDKATGYHKTQTFPDLTSNAGDLDKTSDIKGDSPTQSLPPPAASRGLLHRLQSSVKLKYAQVSSPEPLNQSHQQQGPAVSPLADASRLELARLLNKEREAAQAIPWSPSGQGTHPVLSAAAWHFSVAHAGTASSVVLPSTGIPEDAPICQADRQAVGRSRGTHHRSCKRRAVSAPPHYRTHHHRSAHTNPLHSLHTDLHKLVPPCTVSDALTAHAPATAEQPPHQWMLNRPARQQHTVSGVCSQLRRQLGNSRQAHLSEVYKQKRVSSSSSCQKPDQMPSQPQFPDRPAQSQISKQPDPAETAVHDRALHGHSDSHQLTALKPQTSRKRVRFEPPADDTAPVNDSTADPLPSPNIPTTPRLTLPAAQLPNQQSSSMLSTATPTASAGAGQLLQPQADLSLAQHPSLAVPSITELLQSWANPSIGPQGSRSIADLASVCGCSLHAVVPTAITRSDFMQAQTLCQMENKFIAVVCNGMLAVIDQHAAHERVRLERLRAAVLGSQVGWPILFFH